MITGRLDTTKRPANRPGVQPRTCSPTTAHRCNILPGMSVVENVGGATKHVRVSVRPGAQGRDRRAVPAWRPLDRAGRPGLAHGLLSIGSGVLRRDHELGVGRFPFTMSTATRLRAVTGGHRPRLACCAPIRSRTCCPGGPGSGLRPGRVRKGNASTIGPTPGCNRPPAPDV